MKKILLTIVQLGVMVVLLAAPKVCIGHSFCFEGVFHDPDQRAKMATALRLADYRWVVMGIFAYIVVEIAAAVRWQILLRVQNIRLSLSRVSGLFLIGMFYNQFLPGGTGGDIIKS